MSATPSRACDYLVCNSLGSSKTVKAQKDGIKIVKEEWVTDSIAKGKLSTNSSYILA